MRLTVQIWMLLALLVAGRHFVKAGDEDVMYIDGSGEEPTDVDGGATPDDEDNTEAPGELGSGTDKPAVKSLPTKLAFENTIRIMKIGDKKAVFTEQYNDPNSVESQEVFDTVCSVVSNSLQENQVSSESCVGISITDGSLVVKTKVTFPEGSEVSTMDIQGAIQGSLSGRTLTDGSTPLTIDPSSIAVVPSSPDPEPTNVFQSTAATKKPTKPSKGDGTSKPNKGDQDNDIFFPSTMKPSMDSKTTMSNHLGMGVPEEDPDHTNSLGVKDEKKNEEENFFQMILGNPILLAALVGAVVLTLITVILIIMFMIYRVKKKDEGSYSLDEPHKVKDPTTYWKDTKEFYA